MDERKAIHIRMEQIFKERQLLQEEYKMLFDRLREIDERDGKEPASHDDLSIVQDSEQNQSEKVLPLDQEKNKESFDWEDFEAEVPDEEEIDTEEFDKRLNQLQDFLESEE